jgi:signal transduction histidine kinase
VELQELNAQLRRAEEERRRISLDLHDDPLQRAMHLARELGTMAEQPVGRDALQRCRRRAEELADSLRALATGMHPHALEAGLAEGLAWLRSDVAARTNLSVHLTVAGYEGRPFGRLSEDLEVALFRIAQEALNNCIRHARARSVRMNLVQQPIGTTLTIADDGLGAARSPAARALRDDHAAPALGIAGMRHRLRPWGGGVSVARRRPRGTVVTAVVPALTPEAGA